MTTKSLNEQLDKIDQEMATLDDRRSALIHRMSNPPSQTRGASNILRFPTHIKVTKYSKNLLKPNPWKRIETMPTALALPKSRRICGCKGTHLIPNP